MLLCMRVRMVSRKQSTRGDVWWRYTLRERGREKKKGLQDHGFNPTNKEQHWAMLTSTSPIDKVFYGTIIHSLSLRQIEYIQRGLLIVDALGVIVRMDRNVAPNQLDRLLADVSRENVIVLNDDQFIIPGLIDTHIVGL